MHSCVRVKTGSRVAVCKNYIGHSLVLRALQIQVYDTKNSSRPVDRKTWLLRMCLGFEKIWKTLSGGLLVTKWTCAANRHQTRVSQAHLYAKKVKN